MCRTRAQQRTCQGIERVLHGQQQAFVAASVQRRLAAVIAPRGAQAAALGKAQRGHPRLNTAQRAQSGGGMPGVVRPSCEVQLQQVLTLPALAKLQHGQARFRAARRARLHRVLNCVQVHSSERESKSDIATAA